MKNKIPFLLLALSFVIPALLVTNYTLNHFYVSGGYMLDSGFLAYLTSHPTDWPLSNPPSTGGTFFSFHFSPGFYIFSFLYQLISHLGLQLHNTVWFSLIHGFWFGVLSVSIFVLLLGLNRKKSITHVTTAFLISMASGLNGISLANIGFPHYEIAIPSLLMAFFALYTKESKKLGYLVLFVGLLMREDAGLHYFGVFSLLALYLRFYSDAKNAKSNAILFARIAGLCLIYSIGVILFQKIFFATGDNALVRVYLGDPKFQHLSLSFILSRAHWMLYNRLYIFVPLIVSAGLAAVRRDITLLIGCISVIPWIIFSFLGVSNQAGTLTSYYAFPVITAILWPVIAIRLSQLEVLPLRVYSSYSCLTIPAIVVISSIVFFIGSDGNHDANPWQRFGFEWYGKITRTHSALHRFLEQNAGTNYIIFDDSVASLENETAKSDNWTDQMRFDYTDLKTVDAMIFQPGTWLNSRANEIIDIAGLRNLCKLEDTPFIVASKKDRLLPECNAVK